MSKITRIAAVASLTTLLSTAAQAQEADTNNQMALGDANVLAHMENNADIRRQIAENGVNADVLLPLLAEANERILEDLTNFAAISRAMTDETLTPQQRDAEVARMLEEIVGINDADNPTQEFDTLEPGKN